jgi:hypothetical protein
MLRNIYGKLTSVHKGRPRTNPTAQTQKVIVVSQDLRTLNLIAITPLMTQYQIVSYGMEQIQEQMIIRLRN